MILADQVRRVVLRIEAEGSTSVIGSLIWTEGDDAWIAARSELRPTAVGGPQRSGPTTSRNYYWRRPKPMSYEQILSLTATEQFPRMQLIPEELPDIWLLTDDQLAGDQFLPLGMRYSQEQLRAWKLKRDSHFDLIRSLVGDRTLPELLYDRTLDAAVTAQAPIAGKSKSNLWTLVNRYIVAGADKRGLLPLTRNSGAPGKPKFFSRPSGRANSCYQLNLSTHRGFVCDELDRLNCRLGWDLFIKDGNSIDTAYERFCEKFYIESMNYVSASQVEVKLLAVDKRPSRHQFEYFGRGRDIERSPLLLRSSARSIKNDVEGYRGPADSGIKNALQLGIIDSTSDDQNLCSCSSTLLMLQSSWTTRVLDAKSEYCFGEYTSFERASARTHLAALVHAATPKVEWASRIGYELNEGEWHHGVFAGVRADNGEGKSLEATNALEASGVDMEYTPAFYARGKNICENQHLLQHRLVDWRIPGSTMGRMRQRGEKLRNDSPFNFTQFQHMRIKGVMHHNNIVQVPRLLTVEMRRAGVEATRRGIFEYLRDTGQIQSSPYDLAALYPSTLPLINAQIEQDGVHLWDPRVEKGRRKIPNLVYWSEWLFGEGYLRRGGLKPMPVSAALDGSYIGRIWLQEGVNWRVVDLQTQDPEKKSLTLIDWLAISDHDSTRKFVFSQSALESRASINSAIARAAEEAKARRVLDLSGKSEASAGTKRSRTADELDRINADRLGLTQGVGSLTRASLEVKDELAFTDQWASRDCGRSDDIGVDAMAVVRAQRKARREL